ncbi:unnamed protein product [Peniophora sp. CBMAI 1063]|nr:unnamed protein product [Peniophora sp. CBMAI 1063]
MNYKEPHTHTVPWNAKAVLLFAIFGFIAVWLASKAPLLALRSIWRSITTLLPSTPPKASREMKRFTTRRSARRDANLPSDLAARPLIHAATWHCPDMHAHGPSTNAGVFRASAQAPGESGGTLQQSNRINTPTTPPNTGPGGLEMPALSGPSSNVQAPETPQVHPYTPAWISAAERKGSSRPLPTADDLLPTNVKAKDAVLTMILKEGEHTHDVTYYRSSGTEPLSHPSISTIGRPGDTFVHHVLDVPTTVWYRNTKLEWEVADEVAQRYPYLGMEIYDERTRYVLNVRDDGFATWVQNRTAKRYEAAKRQRKADVTTGYKLALKHINRFIFKSVGLSSGAVLTDDESDEITRGKRKQAVAASEDENEDDMSDEETLGEESRASN